MNGRTAPRPRTAAAMLVGLAPEVATTSSQCLTALGFRVTNVAHVAAACERLAVVMPLLVVADAAMGERERADLEDRAIAVGGKLIWMPGGADRASVIAALKEPALAIIDKHLP